MTDDKDHLMHYCQGTYVDGFVLDCEVEDHEPTLFEQGEVERNESD